MRWHKCVERNGQGIELCLFGLALSWQQYALVLLDADNGAFCVAQKRHVWSCYWSYQHLQGLTSTVIPFAFCGRSGDRQWLEIGFMAAPPARVVNTSGAGDCLVAGALFGLLRGCNPTEALAHGMVCHGFCPLLRFCAICRPLPTCSSQEQLCHLRPQ